MPVFRSTVLLVDDHPLVRLGLRNLLAQEPDLEVVGEAGTAEDAVQLIDRMDPDVLVLDLSLGDASGLDLLKQVLRRWPHLGVLVLSMHDQRIYAQRVLKAGARGYLMKEDAGDRVVEAVRIIAAGGVFLPPTREPVEPTTGVDLATLSDRELQVFELVGDGLATRAIAARLGLSDQTVEVHKTNLRRKMGAANAQDLLRLAIAWRGTDPAGGRL